MVGTDNSGIKGVIVCPFSTSLYDFFRVLLKVYNILWIKNSKWQCENTLFTLSKSAQFQQAVLVHVALNANELC